MVLDLVVRQAASTGSPAEHLMAVAAASEGSRVILYGMAEEGLSPEYERLAGPDALEWAVKQAGDASLLVYGDESLLVAARELQPNLVWIPLAQGMQSIREVWRLRQQHPWLDEVKLGLILEDAEVSEPERERLMRFSRAVRALTLAPGARETVGQATPEAESQEAPAAPVAVGAVATTAVPKPQPARRQASERKAARHQGAERLHERTQRKGANLTMIGTKMPATASEAEQAIIQRYGLVRERRAAIARLAEVEAAIQHLLKELFVTRFTTGPDAAAALAESAGQLAEAASEFSQLQQKLAGVNQQLEQLSWVKGELDM